VRRGRGDGTFGDPQRLDLNGNIGSVAAGDLDADGRLDLVATTLAGQVSIYAGHGDGTFSLQTALGGSTFGESHPFAIVITDLDADGDQDLALVSGGVSVL